MQIREFIPSVVENENTTMRNKETYLESGPLLFRHSWYYINSGL